jgi:uncharacterized SAM-binding protein YcdF (DUF218 family)
MYPVLVTLLQPQVLLNAILVITLIRLWRRREVPRRLLWWFTVPFVLLFVLCLPVTSYLALGTLEWRYPPRNERPVDLEAIVVLSGYVKPANAWRREPELGEDTLYRCLKAADVYRQGARCPVVVSGGKVDPEGAEPACADVMQAFLPKLGVEAKDIIPENRSRSTFENAVASAAILKERGIKKAVLVTDGAHLFRSVRCFQKQGIEVVPCGCRYRATSLDGSIWDFVPDPAVLTNISEAVHEWVGCAWYALRGRM